jgi:glycosyltransferase 2 family protein
MKRWQAALGFAVSAVLIWWTLKDVDLRETWGVVREGNLLLLLAAISVATAGFAIRAIRWRILLQQVKPDTPFRSRFAATTIGFMANNLLPARVGEFVRAFAFGRLEKVSFTGVFGSLVIERVLDGVVLASFFVLPMMFGGFPGGALASGTMGANILRGMIVVLLAMFAFIGVLIAWPRRAIALAERMLRPFPHGLARRLIDAMEGFVDGLQLVRQPGAFLLAVLWSFGFWAWHGLSFYLAMLAFGIDTGFLSAIFTEATVGFGVALPAAPGFFGTFHKAAQWALTDVYGVDAARSTAFAYGYHLGGFIPVTLIGLYFAREMGLSLGQMTQAEEVVETAVEKEAPGRE